MTNSIEEIFCCKSCGKSSKLTVDSFFGPDRAYYCDRFCFFGHKKITVIKKTCNCSVCNKEVTIKGSEYIEQTHKFSGEVYCSKICENNRKKARSLKCTNCKAEKLVPISRWRAVDKKNYCCADCIKTGVKAKRSIKPPAPIKVPEVKSKTFYCCGCNQPIVYTGEKLTTLEREIKANPNRRVICGKPECRSKTAFVISQTRDRRTHCKFEVCTKKVVSGDYCSETCRQLDFVKQKEKVRAERYQSLVNNSKRIS